MKFGRPHTNPPESGLSGTVKVPRDRWLAKLCGCVPACSIAAAYAADRDREEPQNTDAALQLPQRLGHQPEHSEI